MYSIVEIGGKQFKVEKGSVIDIDRVRKKPGESIELKKVLMHVDGEKVNIGQPFIKNAKVVVEVQEEIKAKKVLVFKKKRRKDYKKKTGHRQKYTTVLVKEIIA